MHSVTLFNVISVWPSNRSSLNFSLRYSNPHGFFSSSSNNFSLHAAMNVTRFSRALKHGRANARLTIFLLLFLSFFFLVLSKLHADRYGATTEVASPDSGRGKVREQIEARSAFFAAFLHNSSSPFAAYVFLFYSSLDFCAHSRSVLIHSNSRRLFARDPKTRHRTPFRARAVYSRFDMYSHIESKRVSAYSVRVRRTRIRAYVHRYAPTSWRAPNVGVALSRV